MRFVISIVAALMILSLAAFGVASAQLKPSQSVGGLSTCQRRILRLRTLLLSAPQVASHVSSSPLRLGSDPLICNLLVPTMATDGAAFFDAFARR